MTVEVAFFNAAGLLPGALEAEIRAGIDEGADRAHAPSSGRVPWHAVR